MEFSKPFDRTSMRCLRCDSAMASVGVKRFHTGGEWREMLTGGMGDDGLKPDVWRCIRCRRIELFETYED